MVKKDEELNFLLKEIENRDSQNRYKEAIRDYEESKREYIENQWKAQIKHRNKLFEHVFIWLLVPISIGVVCYFESWSDKLKYTISGVTSLVSFLLSYKNKDHFHFSKNYLWSSSKTEEKFRKEYKSKYEKENPKPTPP